MAGDDTKSNTKRNRIQIQRHQKVLVTHLWAEKSGTWGKNDPSGDTVMMDGRWGLGKKGRSKSASPT